jgi:REP element-mobilizing transposase RayT
MDSAADRTFFVTTNTAGKRRLFQVSANAELLLGLLKEDRARGRYEVHPYVIMPDHIHLILTPAPEVSLEKAMQFIKGGFSFRLKSKTKVWQESFAWERVKDARDFASHAITSMRTRCVSFFVRRPETSSIHRPAVWGSMRFRRISGPEGPFSRAAWREA